MLIGIVGKPSCGKSTFFKALTLADVAIASYPFTTIKPNRGVGHVRVGCADRFFNVQCNPREGYCIGGNRFVPVELLDVAGLVPGAHEGKGLGNQFLDDLRQAHVLIHVIDASGSTNAHGEAVPEGSYDPSNDILFLEKEMDLWYLSILKRPWEKFSRQTFMEHQKLDIAISKQFSGLNANDKMVGAIIERLHLDSENPTRWSENDLGLFATELRKETKPIIIAANKADSLVAQANIKKLSSDFPGYTIVPCSAECELALKEASKKGLIVYIAGESSFMMLDEGKLNEKQKAALKFVEDRVLSVYSGTGVQETLNRAVFDVLGCKAVFPGGVNKLSDQYGRVLPDCFLMPGNSTALDFAFRIHTDIGSSFIRAIDVKRRQTIGKEHVLQNGDVIEIISGK
ncbi:redox-regulated ATPase YchF [Candidatus Woesearchaeota archaeon]|nr:redox-regulated ATPase YchF [Candidatus Woesearchaeota archaeon]